jgi:hypothetical protein
VSSAFKRLQSTIGGISVDGKIGSQTATQASTRLGNLIENRTYFKVSALDYVKATVIQGFYRKYTKPYAIAVYADQITELLIKYTGGAKTTTTLAPTVVDMGPTEAGFGTGTLALVGLGVLGLLALRSGPVKGPRPRRRAKTSRRRR